MTTNKNVCYIGRHIGCLNATNPDCRTCAERLNNAVNFIAHEANDGARQPLRLQKAIVS